MKKTEYIGEFKSTLGHIYHLKVKCNGFLQAFFLLTADAIRSGRHYQLDTITDENYNVRKIDDILKCSELLN
jgi:hypothetical protein